jgi:hypothetical protein
MRSVRITRDAPHNRSGHPQDQSETEIPIAHRVRSAGSFLGDFRTPAGARNSSRKRNGRAWVNLPRKRTFGSRPIAEISSGFSR